VLFCAHGFSSSFAAATLRDLGCLHATDVVGGFKGWKAAGLPVRAFVETDEAAEDELPGMGAPAFLEFDDSWKEARWQST
jgi:hypothetical protein